MQRFDMGLVVNHVDPYLALRVVKKSYNPDTGVMGDVQRWVIVDDGLLLRNDAMMTNSQVTTAQVLRGLAGPNNTEGYWMEYGRRVHEEFVAGRPFGLRCDSCTALAFYLLRHNGFTGSLAVIEQGTGNATGHWFLLAGCPADALIGYPDRFPRGSFTIDLWGTGVLQQRGVIVGGSSLASPARCIYDCGNNGLTRKVYFPGATTVPTTASFVRDTTVAGCWWGNKSRSAALQVLDRRLDEYHRGAATLIQLGAAFTAWLGEKAQRRGAVIDTIRDADGAMTRLRRQLGWLGRAV